MPDSQQLGARITSLREVSTQLIDGVNAARGEFKRWEQGGYDLNGTGLTDQMVHDAGFETKSANQVRAMVNAIAGIVADFDADRFTPLEEMSS